MQILSPPVRKVEDWSLKVSCQFCGANLLIDYKDVYVSHWSASWDAVVHFEEYAIRCAGCKRKIEIPESAMPEHVLYKVRQTMDRMGRR